MQQPELQFNTGSVHKAPQHSGNKIKQSRWWGAIWRGLPVEPTGKHYRAMRCSVWLYLYLIIHANRKSGLLYRRVATISQDMGVSERTIRHWLTRLRRQGYITTSSTGRALNITVNKWKPL